MSLASNIHELLLGGGSTYSYTINNSLRFRGSASAYLSRTPASAGNRQTWTWSGWVKRGSLQTSARQTIFSASDGTLQNYTEISFDTNSIRLLNYTANVKDLDRTSTSVYRDPSAWYHIVLAFDTTQSTATNRQRVYINGVEVTAWTNTAQMAQNANGWVNSTQPHRVAFLNGFTSYFDGYLTEINFIDGQALTPSSFGATNTTTGTWAPKAYSGTYGTNGFYLKFNNQTNTTTLGYDSSGNGNNWATNNIATIQSVDYSVGITTSGSSMDNSPVTMFNGSLSTWWGAGQNPGYNGTAILATAIPTTGVTIEVAAFSGGSAVAGVTLYSSGGSSVYKSFSGTSSPYWQTFSAISDIKQIKLSQDGGGYGGMGIAAIRINGVLLTTSGSIDMMTDSPTPKSSTVGNYAVLNPLDAYSGTLSNGNLYWTGSYGSQNGHGVRSTLKVRPVGKWYVEAYNTTISGSGNGCMLGFTSSTQTIASTAFGQNLTPWLGVDASVFNNNVRFYSAGVSGSLADATVLFASYASGDLISIAIDFDSGKIWIGKNGTWYNSGNPATGVNATSTFTSGSLDWAFWAEYVAASNDTNRSGAVCNFGQRPFAYTPPTGFKALQTYNLPTPAIKKGNQHFDATLYTGNGATQSITNSGFKPDLVWNKQRSAVRYHDIYDSVRGATLELSSNDTVAEQTISGVTSFDSSGFTLGSNDRSNVSGGTYVSWQWKGGGTAVTNTNGSISSQVSANPSAGFSIVTYTGTGSNATVGHGLGVAPSMFIIKKRSSTSNWPVYHQSLTANGGMFLNLTDAYGADSTKYNNTAPTSTVFTIGSPFEGNTNGATYVAYCFAAIPGYSAFGSYVGNSSADGVFIHTGFRPRWIMIKSSTGAYNWVIFDAMRLGYNYDATYLLANSSNAEGTDPAPGTGSWAIDILSNGFKNRDSAVTLNNSGQTYIYAAFAESPFQYSLGR